MAQPLDKTFRYFARSGNNAAVEILKQALQSEYPEIRELAIETILSMKIPGIMRGAFVQFIDDRVHMDQIAQDNPARLAKITTNAAQVNDSYVNEKAFQEIVRYKVYDSLPAIIECMDDPNDPKGQEAAHAMLHLTEDFYEEMVSTNSTMSRRDLDQRRDWITKQLERAVNKYPVHNHDESIQAFLTVTRPNNRLLNQILTDPLNGCHKETLEILHSSQKNSVIRLLLNYVENMGSPASVAKVIVGRTDLTFVDNLLRTIGLAPSFTMKRHLSTFAPFAWGIPNHPLFSQLPGPLQANAIELLRLSGLDRDLLIEMLKFMFAEGAVEGRRAAAEILNDLRGQDANDLAVLALQDQDQMVRAILIRKMRERNIPDCIPLLMRVALDSPDREIKSSLCKALPEFNFDSFLSRFDQMPERAAVKLALLVRDIDEDAKEKLVHEMDNISPVRRRRAVMATCLMRLVSGLESNIIRLTEDEDYMVRVAACEALSQSNSRKGFEALRNAMSDRSPSVQRTARHSLALVYQHVSVENQTARQVAALPEE